MQNARTCERVVALPVPYAPGFGLRLVIFDVLQSLQGDFVSEISPRISPSTGGLAWISMLQLRSMYLFSSHKLGSENESLPLLGTAT